jgi:endonuclease-3
MVKMWVQTEKDAKRLFPEEIWNDLHLQIIWYGREDILQLEDGI